MYRLNRVRSRKELPYIMSGDETIFRPKGTDSFDEYSLDAVLRKLSRVRKARFQEEERRRNFGNRKD